MNLKVKLLVPVALGLLFSAVPGFGQAIPRAQHGFVGMFSYTFFDAETDLPATLDVPSIFVNRGYAFHITEVYCEADTENGAVINITNAGDSVLSSNLTCTTSGASSTSFVSGKNAVALNAKISHVMVSVEVGLKRLNVVVKYTVD